MKPYIFNAISKDKQEVQILCIPYIYRKTPRKLYIFFFEDPNMLGLVVRGNVIYIGSLNLYKILELFGDSNEKEVVELFKTFSGLYFINPEKILETNQLATFLEVLNSLKSYAA